MSLAFAQAGYFTTAQALKVGYSYQAQKYHADHGNWIRVDRALYRIPDWPAQAQDAFVRWALWSDGRGVISHESALAMHGLSDVNPTRIHLTVDPGFRARNAAVNLHFDDLAAAHVEEHGAWAVTTPGRTLLDAADSDLAQEHVDRAVADALAGGLVTRRRLIRAADGAPDRTALRIERALAAHQPSA